MSYLNIINLFIAPDRTFQESRYQILSKKEKGLGVVMKIQNFVHFKKSGFLKWTKLSDNALFDDKDWNPILFSAASLKSD